jgi:DNA-binding transcriptional ArsR family regulator
MESTPLPHLPEIFKLAGHPIRWNLLTRLARSDERVQDLVEQLKLPQNLISYHLRQLRDGNLVHERRSSADERTVYYSLNFEQFQTQFLSAGNMLHPAMTNCSSEEVEELDHLKPPLRVLFLWGFSDPSQVTGSEEKRLAVFRHVRDLIAAKINQFLARDPSLSLEWFHAAGKAEEQS